MESDESSISSIQFSSYTESSHGENDGSVSDQEVVSQTSVIVGNGLLMDENQELHDSRVNIIASSASIQNGAANGAGLESLVSEEEEMQALALKEAEEAKKAKELVFLSGKKIDKLDNGTLGSGSCGTVILVKKEGETFAMKIQKKSGQKFKDEIEIWKKLSYPFIVSLAIHFENDGYDYLLMEAAIGSLMDCIRHLKSSNRKVYAKEIFLAIEYLHGKNIIHGDIKPENILVKENGHILLADFGLSQFMKNGKIRNHHSGTTFYLAPELIHRCKEHCEECKAIGNFSMIGPEIDWWGFGAVLYYMHRKWVQF